MKKLRFTESQIVLALKKAVGFIAIIEILRRMVQTLQLSINNTPNTGVLKLRLKLVKALERQLFD